MLRLGVWRIPPHEREVERDGRGLHRDAPQLLVWPGVQIADLARQFGRDDAICGDEGVGQGGLAMVLCWSV